MGRTTLINLSELIPRFIVGIAFYSVASSTAFPAALKVIGVFLSLTAVLLILTPKSIHNGYAVWWADRLSPWMVRIAASLSLMASAAIFLLYLVSFNSLNSL